MAFHVRGFGWVYEVSDLGPVVRDPDPFPRYVDPEQERRDVSERLRLRELERNPPAQPWPEPEVPMRVVELGAVPSAPRAMVKAAQSAGWRVIATYARGTWPGRAPRVIGSWALRMGRGPSRAVAVWHESSGRLTAHAAYRWGDCGLRSVGFTELRKEIG